MSNPFRRRACRALAAVCVAFAGHAMATFHQFVIDQIYSNADGTIQFIVFLQTPPANDEHEWRGHKLVSVYDGADHNYFYPRDLPSRLTRNKRVLVATQGFADLNIVKPDYVIPNGFIHQSSVQIRCCDTYEVVLGSLPTDGVTALDERRQPVPNLATNFAGESGSVTAAQANPGGGGGGTPAVAAAVEYYNADLDHYFITHIVNEIALLDAGTTIKGWARTGQGFNVYAAAGAGLSPVCRFYIPPDKGNSHFYGRGTAECNGTAAANPTFFNEDPQFFHIVLPAAGTCPAGTRSVYRVFSNRPDANHRYMVDRALRDQMTGKGWLAEGDGPDMVVMCSPQ
jgi:hypothetical protein